MAVDPFKERAQLRGDLAELARRYVAHHQGDELDGLAALGEDLLGVVSENGKNSTLRRATAFT